MVIPEISEDAQQRIERALSGIPRWWRRKPAVRVKQRPFKIREGAYSGPPPARRGGRRVPTGTVTNDRDRILARIAALATKPKATQRGKKLDRLEALAEELNPPKKPAATALERGRPLSGIASSNGPEKETAQICTYAWA